MKLAMSISFDRVAESYDSSIPPLPEKYIQLIKTRFELSKNDKVIDLGCGSGLLTFALLRFSSKVQGIDSSRELIRIARKRDVEHRIEWILCPVEEFDFGCGHYKLIISFEAFHLFPDACTIFNRCAIALKPGGFFCVGWVNFEWEIPFKEIMYLFTGYKRL